MPILCEFRRQLDPARHCPRCAWGKQADDKLCICCRSEDKLRAENHPILKGQDHRDEFAACYAPGTSPYYQSRRSDSAPWNVKRKAPGLKRS